MRSHLLTNVFIRGMCCIRIAKLLSPVELLICCTANAIPKRQIYKANPNKHSSEKRFTKEIRCSEGGHVPHVVKDKENSPVRLWGIVLDREGYIRLHFGPVFVAQVFNIIVVLVFFRLLLLAGVPH